MMKMLNERQKKFCYEYAKLGNATAAYKLAGYNVKDDNSAAVNANKLLRKDKVMGFLSELSEQARSSQIADVIECQQILTLIARDKDLTAKDRISAINTLLKTQGAFAQNVNLNGACPVVIYGEERILD